MTDTQWVLLPVDIRRVVDGGPLLYFVTDAILSEPPPLPAAVLDVMVERGARALRTDAATLEWEDLDEGGRIYYRRKARACILAALGDA